MSMDSKSLRKASITDAIQGARKIQAATKGNVPSEMCDQRRLRSDCASAQSDQSLRCLNEESLHISLSRMRPVNILIRLI